MYCVTMASLSTSDVQRMFNSLDQNKDGLLTLDELVWLLDKTGVHVSEDELASLVGKEGLDFDEFSYFYDMILLGNNVGNGGSSENNNDEVKEEEVDKDLYKAFKVFDLNGDGLISSQELQSVLWKLGMWDNFGGLDCDRIISKYDVNSDGFVDFSEFKSMMLAH
ncbi:probable calcium-binding protein CML44 [Chenopodium quinoa]|uniref:EF-hand domain-containing protein n=1 Tax=Chenopodium quinoa TaxID=63459 RepID=A0A803L760_CHEQI|nr:probable calcium-binding protein CML44 [Chenopodium quinoa]